jgi:hypothetical protein
MEDSYSTGHWIARRNSELARLKRVRQGVSLDKKSLFGLNNHDLMGITGLLLFLGRSVLRE